MVEISKTKALEIHCKLWEIRLFELKASELYKDGTLPGFIHLSVGQEACAVGACLALKRDDFITSTHRGHGHCLAKGADAKAMMAELAGKETGYSKGRGGSMHIADVSVGVLGANGIVGQSAPLACGAAYTAQVKKTGQIALAFFGEGASGAGPVHEAMNIAALWKLPVIFFCECNRYAELSPFDVHVSVPNVSARAKGYGFEGVTIDGSDVMEVYSSVLQAASKVRQGMGPILIEAKTHRWHGHYEGDPMNYLDRSERDPDNRIDPIQRFESDFAGTLELSPDDLLSPKKKALALVDQAVEFALSSQNPSSALMMEDVLS